MRIDIIIYFIKAFEVNLRYPLSQICDDINECERDNGECVENSYCINTQVSCDDCLQVTQLFGGFYSILAGRTCTFSSKCYELDLFPNIYIDHHVQHRSL